MAPDERHQASISRSVRLAYSFLIAGMILVGVVMPLHSGGWRIVNAALFMIVAGQVLCYAVVVMGDRRQT